MISTKIKRQLNQVDWDFSQNLPGTSKTIHWYPGTFPADIPTTLIQALSKPGELVFDPYGGTGTSALEAIRQGRRALLTETNPVGCLASYVAGGVLLLKASNPALVSALFREVREILQRIDKNSKYQLSFEGASSSCLVDSCLDLRIFPSPADFIKKFERRSQTSLLSAWFEKTTLRSIKILLKEFDDASLSPFTRLVGKTLTSAILRPASSQIQSWGHIADNVWPKELVSKDVFRLAQQWLSRFESIVEKTDVVRLDKNASSVYLSVLEHNWSQPGIPNGAPETRSKLLVTSPPYAGAIDYTLAQRLSLYAFGFSDKHLGDLWRAEFGARRKRNSPNSRMRWADELSASLKMQLEQMDTNAFAAFVLPHKDEGRDMGAKHIQDSMELWGWDKIIEVDRSIRQIRARQSWTSIKRETIHIFGR